MKLYIHSEVPLRLAPLAQCLRQVNRIPEQTQPTADWVQALLDQAEEFRPYFTGTASAWDEEKLAVLALAALEQEVEIICHPLVLPTGMQTVFFPLLEGTSVGNWTGAGADGVMSPHALLWLKHRRASYTDRPVGQIVQTAMAGRTAIVLLEDNAGVPIRWEERNHQQEHIDEGMLLLQVNLDDTSPEWMAYALQRLLQAGANDVTFIPMTMKKSRPGVMMQVLCYRSDLEGIKSVIFAETTTFGIRYFPVAVHRLARSFTTVQTKWGEVPVKLGYHHGERVQASPEYEACARLASMANVPLPLVYLEARRLATKDE
ncbi:nickel pincer cofactor biosynthesis protein LarC2 [Brevibacillus migulae]|uniref:nickel insertion protein n=1 Tax=Brevibacillus migulae TaxID=1644114 RepID=UPI001F2051F9|nr:nickel insertion protein [Brevibacillus migulae]